MSSMRGRIETSAGFYRAFLLLILLVCVPPTPPLSFHQTQFVHVLHMILISVCLFSCFYLRYHDDIIVFDTRANTWKTMTVSDHMAHYVHLYVCVFKPPNTCISRQRSRGIPVVD